MARLTRLCFEDLCSEVPETYSKEEINALIAGLENVVIEVVDELPQEGETNIIYLVPNEGETPNIYDEYVWVYDVDTDTGIFELIGSTQINLTQYYTKAQIDALVDSKQDTLVSGTNIKTINNQSLLGSGNITISGSMTKAEILSALGYEETNLTLTDTDGNSVTKTILAKSDDIGGV